MNFCSIQEQRGNYHQTKFSSSQKSWSEEPAFLQKQESSLNLDVGYEEIPNPYQTQPNRNLFVKNASDIRAKHTQNLLG